MPDDAAAKAKTPPLPFPVTGRRYGALRVEGEAPPQPEDKRFWCRCACGRVDTLRAQDLRDGSATECRTCWALALLARRQ